MLKQLRFELKDVILFIIDEISMVANLTLMYINLRLCEIFNTVDEKNGWFGKKHLLVFGDLLQLHEDSPFVQLNSHRLNTSIGALSSINIWRELFTYDELTINMRQAEDAEYADLLSRVRLGQIDISDVSILLQKRIPLTGLTVAEKIAAVAEYLSSLPMLHH
uniref:ATP-dependent DNA helicase n=1 Tax=Cacopsylla melanoneura TaxID=428564 RepID=A0A8D8TGZ7_9HEMI